MIVTEVQFKTKTKKQNRPIVCTKSLIPWVNRGPSAQSTSPTSPLLPVSCLFCCCHPGFPIETQRGPALPCLRPFAHAVVRCLEYSTHGSWQAYPCSFLPGFSASLFPSRPKQVSCESLCQSILLILFLVCHTIWNYMSTFLPVFLLLSCIYRKLLKHKDHVRSHSPLQPHCPEQGLTYV